MTGINVEREILLPLLLDSNEIYKIKKRKKKKDSNYPGNPVA